MSVTVNIKRNSKNYSVFFKNSGAYLIAYTHIEKSFFGLFSYWSMVRENLIGVHSEQDFSADRYKSCANNNIDAYEKYLVTLKELNT